MPVPVVSGLIHPLAAPFRLDGDNRQAFVLLHGFTGNPAHFRPLARRLHDRGYTVMAPLLPGHGRDPSVLENVTRHDWIAATVDSVREVADHRRTHLVGLSMGGLLAIVAAARTPVATLTTINSPVAYRDRSIHLAFLAHRVRPGVDAKDEPAPLLDLEVAPYWIHGRGFPTRSAAELRALSWAARRVARSLAIPSLVIQSKTDETVRPRSGPILQRALGPRSRLLWLEHSIHNALFDTERDAIHDAILELATE